MRPMNKMLGIVLILGFSFHKTEAYPTYRWDPVDHAASYLGVIFVKGGHIFFTTSGTELFVEEVAPELQISAFSATGELLQKVRPYRVDLDSAPKLPIPVPVPLPTVKKQATDATIQELEQEKRDAFSLNPYRYLSAHLGLGQEVIHSSNADNQYSGKAQLATFGLELEVTLTPRSSIATSLQVHPFSTVTQTGQTEETIAVRRSYLTAAYMYRLDALSFPHTSIQVGAGALELPILVEPDASGEPASFQSFFALGPYMGIRYLRPLASLPSFSFGGMLSSMPFLLGSNSGMSVEASGQTLFFPVDNLFLTGAILYRYQKISRSIACMSQNKCHENSQTDSNIQLIYIGIGVFF